MKLLPVRDLLFGFLFCDPIFRLDLTDENVALSCDLIEFIIGQIAPLLFDLTCELFPVISCLTAVYVYSPNRQTKLKDEQSNGSL